VNEAMPYCGVDRDLIRHNYLVILSDDYSLGERETDEARVTGMREAG
jgi:hypothetical protein